MLEIEIQDVARLVFLGEWGCARIAGWHEAGGYWGARGCGQRVRQCTSSNQGELGQSLRAALMPPQCSQVHDSRVDRRLKDDGDVRGLQVCGVVEV
jgi:hypothetical protein